jgi:hypothetical protein
MDLADAGFADAHLFTNFLQAHFFEVVELKHAALAWFEFLNISTEKFEIFFLGAGLKGSLVFCRELAQFIGGVRVMVFRLERRLFR